MQIKICPEEPIVEVLTNDLKEVVNHGDYVNKWLLPVFMAWLYNEAPATCWGSYDKVDKWIEDKNS